MEREKRELQEFIGEFIVSEFDELKCIFPDKDNKRMADKIQAENEERQKKEQEMKKRLAEAQEASENGTIQLYKKMAAENSAREAEIAELRDRLNQEKEELAQRMEKEKNDMKERLEKENQALKDKLNDDKQFLQVIRKSLNHIYL